MDEEEDIVGWFQAFNDPTLPLNATLSEIISHLPMSVVDEMLGLEEEFDEDAYVDFLLEGGYDNEENVDLGDPINRIDDLVMYMLDLYMQNEYELSQRRLLRINDARPSNTTGAPPQLIDLLAMSDIYYRPLQTGEHIPLRTHYDIGNEVPFNFTVSQLMDAVQRVSDYYDIDVGAFLRNSWLSNIKFEDPRDKRIKSFSIALLDALMDANYDENEIPEIFNTRIYINSNSKFVIKNIEKPQMRSNKQRNKYGAGTNSLHPSITSPTLFIPHSDAFCIEEAYNHITQSGPYGFVRKCMELWQDYLAVIIPDDFMDELEEMTKMEQLEHLIANGVKPQLVTLK